MPQGGEEKGCNIHVPRGGGGGGGGEVGVIMRHDVVYEYIK